MTNETELLRLYCLAAAVALKEKGLEAELVARILVVDAVTEALNHASASPQQKRIWRAAWRKLFDEVAPCMAAHQPLPVPRLKAHRRKPR